MGSILNYIKIRLGYSDEPDLIIDTQIMDSINTAFAVLSQIGTGLKGDFVITSSNETWDQYCTGNVALVELIKSYIYCKTKLEFDPSANSTINDSLTRRIAELESRINSATDYPDDQVGATDYPDDQVVNEGGENV